MLSIFEVNSRRPRCRQCGCLADVVAVEEGADRRELFDIYTADQFLRFVPRIREISGCGIGEAKATYLHLAAAGRKCHRCSTLLGLGEIVDCSKCESLNLVWE